MDLAQRCPVCLGTGQVEHVPLFGRTRKRPCGICQGSSTGSEALTATMR